MTHSELSHPHVQLVSAILDDLLHTLPEDFSYRLALTDEGLAIDFQSAGLGGCGWVRLDDSRCGVAEKVISDLQDFVADVYGMWWPMLGRQRLNFQIDCVDDRPKLVFTLAK